jgi:hypothetical protein
LTCSPLYILWRGIYSAAPLSYFCNGKKAQVKADSGTNVCRTCLIQATTAKRIWICAEKAVSLQFQKKTKETKDRKENKS